MNKLNELIEWMEGELDVVKKNNAAAYLYRCGVADTLERNITKAKELEAANCDHKDCRNSGKDLRQELIEKGYDMNQYPDQVTDHDRASTVQEPDKSEWTLKILADAKKKNPAKTTPGEPHLAARWGVVEEADIYESQKVAKHVADDYNKLVMAPNFITVKIIP